MLNQCELPTFLWAEVINTNCYTSNRVHVHPHTKKNCYDLWKGKKASVKHFRVVGSKLYTLKDNENLRKWRMSVHRLLHGLFVYLSHHSMCLSLSIDSSLIVWSHGDRIASHVASFSWWRFFSVIVRGSHPLTLFGSSLTVIFHSSWVPLWSARVGAFSVEVVSALIPPPRLIF